MPGETNKRVILLIGNLTYRGDAFVRAAERLGLEPIQGLDLPRPLADYWQATLPLDFKLPDKAVGDLVAFARERPVRAIVCVDDSAQVIAARACQELGLACNAPQAALAARDKRRMRQAMAAAGVRSPRFRVLHSDDDPRVVASTIDYPCVVKPTLLSGSQGVLRADDADEFVRAFECTRAIALATGGKPGEARRAEILVEDYIDGFEVALEAILTDGALTPLALFDKPDPLVGPTFEETIYVTPSRLPQATQQAIFDTTAEACAALGLREGPVHAELRVNDEGAWIVEVAGRSIGGLCSQILRFGTEGLSLEELILRHALRLGDAPTERESRAGGVMMIPIPAAGMLKRVEGVAEAEAVPGVEGVEISIPLNHPVVPLPEGASYLGFIFARADTPEQAEAALREAHRRLRFVIVPHIVLMREP